MKTLEIVIGSLVLLSACSKHTTIVGSHKEKHRLEDRAPAVAMEESPNQILDANADERKEAALRAAFEERYNRTIENFSTVRTACEDLKQQLASYGPNGELNSLDPNGELYRSAYEHYASLGCENVLHLPDKLRAEEMNRRRVVADAKKKIERNGAKTPAKSLEIGLTKEQVTNLLGKPDQAIDKSLGAELWLYGASQIR